MKAELKHAEIPIALIDAPEWDVRFERNFADIKELAQSIQEHGLLQPIIVIEKENGRRYEVVAGMRRLTACRMLGWTKIPCLVLENQAGARKEVITIVENVQRQDISPVEEAVAYAKLRGMGLTDEEIASLVGKERTYIVKRIALLRLDEETLNAVHKGYLSPSHALELLRIEDEEMRRYYRDIVMEQGASVQQLRRWIDEMLNEAPRQAVTPVRSTSVEEARMVCELCGNAVSYSETKAIFVCRDCLDAIKHAIREEG